MPRTSSLQVGFETFTPRKAELAYSTSIINRHIQNANVLAYSQVMKRGEWRRFPPVYFDRDGHLVDGHNRMKAIMLADVPVRLLTIRGITEADVMALDVGRRRTVPQQFQMFRPEIPNRNTLVSYVNMCAYLLTTNRVKLFTLHDFDEWYSIFKDGIDWAVDYCVNDPVLSPGPVAGALAFAYATNPEKVMEFAKELKEGASLPGRHPAMMLRNSLRILHPGERSATYRIVISRRVLNCTKARISNEMVQRAHPDDEGRAFFARAYSSTAVRELSGPWMPRAPGPVSQPPRLRSCG